MRANVMGPEHLDTADCINLLAMIHKKEGNYEAAKNLYQQAIYIIEKTVGSSHGKLGLYLRYDNAFTLFLFSLLTLHLLVIWVMLLAS